MLSFITATSSISYLFSTMRVRSFPRESSERDYGLDTLSDIWGTMVSQNVKGRVFHRERVADMALWRRSIRDGLQYLL